MSNPDDFSKDWTKPILSSLEWHLMTTLDITNKEKYESSEQSEPIHNFHAKTIHHQNCIGWHKFIWGYISYWWTTLHHKTKIETKTKSEGPWDIKITQQSSQTCHMVQANQRNPLSIMPQSIPNQIKRLDNTHWTPNKKDIIPGSWSNAWTGYNSTGYQKYAKGTEQPSQISPIGKIRMEVPHGGSRNSYVSTSMGTILISRSARVR